MILRAICTGYNFIREGMIILILGLRTNELVTMIVTELCHFVSCSVILGYERIIVM